MINLYIQEFTLLKESDLCKIGGRNISHVDQCYLDPGLKVSYEHSK